MSKKKIEPTDRMIRDVETWGEIMGVDDVDLLRYILNHSDAPGLFTDEDDRSWEPLSDPNMEIIEDARPGDVRAGDHLTRTRVWETCGVVVTDSREGIAHHRDEDGEWYTKDGMWITNGEDEDTTLTIRRTVQELPTKDGDGIIPNDGHKYITATVGGQTYRAREAMLAEGRWRAVWRTADGQRVCYSVRREDITPDVWQVDDQ